MTLWDLQGERKPDMQAYRKLNAELTKTKEVYGHM